MSFLFVFWISLCVICVIGLIISRAVNMQRLRYASKILASSCFVLAAATAFPNPYLPTFSYFLLAGLCCGWLGDVLLLRQGKPWLISGMTMFLLGHLCYIIAFLNIGFTPDLLYWVTPALLLISVSVWRYLRPFLQGSMLYAVTVYTLILLGMCGLGIAVGLTYYWVFALAASLFCLSDWWVARERFVQPGIINQIIGYPLYYAAQCSFAWLIVHTAV